MFSAQQPERLPKYRGLNIINTGCTGCLLMQVVMLGFVLALASLFLLMWPERATAPSDTGGPNLARLSIYAIMLIGFILMGLIITRRLRAMFIGLMGVGLLGLAY